MKTLIVSDTHGSKEKLEKIINSEMPDKVFFLGDCTSDIYKVENAIDADICVVKGNMDYGRRGVDDLVLELHGKKILLTHGHKYNVQYDIYKLYLKAMECMVDYVFFGHTHKYVDLIENDIRFINPGSLSKPRDNNYGSYVIMTGFGSEIKIEKRIVEI